MLLRNSNAAGCETGVLQLLLRVSVLFVRRVPFLTPRLAWRSGKLVRNHPLFQSVMLWVNGGLKFQVQRSEDQGGHGFKDDAFKSNEFFQKNQLLFLRRRIFLFL